MSLYELFVWLIELDFPSLSALWACFIHAPWWLAILSLAIGFLAIRIASDLASGLIHWLSDWMFEAGKKLREWFGVFKRYKRVTAQYLRSAKKALFP